LNVLASVLELSSPFFVKRIIDFIKDKEEDTWFGIMLVALLVIT